MARTLLITLFSLQLVANALATDSPEDFSWAGVVQHIDQDMLVISDRSYALNQVVNITLLNHQQVSLKNIRRDMLFGITSDSNSQTISLWQLSKDDIPAHFMLNNGE